MDAANPIRRSALMLIALLAMGVTCTARADVMWTLDGPQHGKLTFDAGKVAIDGKAASWNQLVLAVRQFDQLTLAEPHLLRLTHGEQWAVTIDQLEDGNLTVRSGLLGQRQLDVDHVAAMDLSGNVGPVSYGRTNVLYRGKGEPVPGKLRWIESNALAIESPLGLISIPMHTATRYVFRAPSERRTNPDAADAIGLLDGTILHGKAEATKDGLTINHAQLGEVTVPFHAVWFVRRTDERVTWLIGPAITRNDSQPLGQAPPVDTLEYRPDRYQPGASVPGRRALRVQPHTELKYVLDADRKVSLRGVVRPADDARGQVVVRFVRDGKTAHRLTMEPNAQPQSLDIDLDKGRTLSIIVDFGKQLGWPAAVDLVDLHLIEAK